MRLAAALVLSLTLSAAAQAQPYPYRALGTEPFWSLMIDSAKIQYRPADGRPIVVATPRVRTTATGQQYHTRNMKVSITHLRCSDGMSDHVYPDTVTVRIGRLARKGCGGAPSGTAAASLLEGAWGVDTIDGHPVVRQSTPRITFRGARLTGTTGCNSFNGGFAFAQGHLQAGTLATTRRGCIGNGLAAQEQRLLALLSQPLSVSRNPAGKLILTGPGRGRLVLTPR